MLVLAFDTAGADCAVAVARCVAAGQELLSRSAETLGRGHGERLLPMIAETLRSAGVTYQDLDRIGVTTGPGSFTGVRVGVAAARALSLALDIPAVGVGSLEALAFPVARVPRAGTVVAVLDARRGDIYARAADLMSASLLIPTIAAPAETIATQLAGAARPLVLTGAGSPLLRAVLPDREPETASLGESPDVADVAWLASFAHPAPPLPIYARGADAKPQGGMAVTRRQAAPAGQSA